MEMPIKDNEHIRADDAAFRSAVARARSELGRMPGVLGVGYGVKERAGSFTSDLAILVYVAEKRPDDALPPDRRIPPTFDGYRTDVRVLKQWRAQGLICDDDSKHDTITGGIQIEAKNKLTPLANAGIGTLGCIVRKRGDRGDDNVYLLTCQHVLLHEDLKTRPGDGVYHPWYPRTTPAVKKGILLGTIDEALARKGHVQSDGKPVPNEPSVHPAPLVEEIDPDFDGTYVDCAAVRLELGSFCCGSACSPNDIQWAPTIPFLNQAGDRPSGDAANLDRVVDVRDLRSEPVASLIGTRVVKNGVKTARTVGRITGIGPAHSIVEYPPGERHVIEFAYNVIEIVLDAPPPAKNPCTNENEFGDSGDSGSLVLDEQNRAVGLYFGARPFPNSAGVVVGHACFIVPVLDTLGMCIPSTTGTSHGSSNAQDGSGLATIGPLDLPQDEAKTLFASRGTAGVAAARAPATLPPSVTEEQRARMRPLLDQLLTTERGRALHEDFTQLSREIAHLVRGNRTVKVAWQRCRGPAFLASTLNHLRGDTADLPREIDGVSREALLSRMENVLLEQGSNPLRDAIERHRDVLLTCAEAATARECIELLGRADAEISA